MMNFSKIFFRKNEQQTHNFCSYLYFQISLSSQCFLSLLHHLTRLTSTNPVHRSFRLKYSFLHLFAIFIQQQTRRAGPVSRGKTLFTAKVIIYYGNDGRECEYVIFNKTATRNVTGEVCFLWVIFDAVSI